MRACGLTRYSDALMRAQGRGGHEVAYFFHGRHFPRVRGPRLKRYRSGDVRMLELIGTPNHSHWTRGTRHPLRDVANPGVEGAFAAALRDTRPEVVHVHELNGLSSALLEQAKATGAAVVVTLHDYGNVCASVRLLDADGQLCRRRDVGEDCARNCAGAPDGSEHLLEQTRLYEEWRAEQVSPALVPLVRAAFAAAGRDREASGGPAVAPVAPAPHYQRRREVNLRRLNGCDRLVAPSRRVAEVHRALGVDPARLVVQRLALPHLDELRPRREAGVEHPMRFVTLGGLASAAKGGRAVLDAVRALETAGRAGQFRLTVLGHVSPAARAEAAGLTSVALADVGYHPEELDDLLEEADVGLVPSVWEESHGFVGVEMLAKGIPLIGSALGGITEYVREGETGWLNRTATGGELARLMAAAIDDPAGVEAMQRSVRARRADHVRTMAAHVAEVEALYDGIIRSRPSL